jgi:hypothetical protein
MALRSGDAVVFGHNHHHLQRSIVSLVELYETLGTISVVLTSISSLAVVISSSPTPWPLIIICHVLDDLQGGTVDGWQIEIQRFKIRKLARYSAAVPDVVA